MLYKNSPIFLTSVDIQIYDGNSEIQQQIFDELKRVVDERILHEDTINPSKLSIKYGEMGSFIITVRNRFFHNMNGHRKNIQSSNIADSDLLFVAINDLAMQWVSIVLLGVLTHSVSEFLKIKDSK